ncbi:hypothetical protein BB561_003987 [Smittium simulii]|uniref:Uncharacterized protein n=1 Tax=Smittium simulii TaxID=133385 RepID=A0A2T9YIP6_9FUNG|nr:hypothetical protein BB561_003987 [Smittium simulii]
MSNVPGVIPSAAAEVPLTPAKRTRLEYSTVAKTSTTRCKPMQQVVDAACTTFSEECPFCRIIKPETIEHILLECTQWKALRADILSNYIQTYKLQLALTPKLLPASISMRLVGKLLGEELKLSSTEIRKDPNVLCVKTTLATAKFLMQLHFHAI